MSMISDDLAEAESFVTAPSNIIAERFVIARTARGLTQAGAAKLVGVEQASVSRWETGKSMPPIGSFRRIADLLGVPFAWLIGHQDEGPMLNRIADLRTALGMTQQELAEKIGTDKSMVGRLEKGQRNLSPKWRVKIATALGVEPESLASGGVGVEVESKTARPAARFDLPEGPATLTTPPNLSPESIDDLEAWLQVTLRAMRRAVK